MKGNLLIGILVNTEGILSIGHSCKTNKML